jgi:fatty-acyl-CoA synthase
MDTSLSYWAADTAEPIRNWTVGDMLREVAAAVPDRVGLVAGVRDPSSRRRWTYGQMLSEAERVAGALLGRFQPGERIAVSAPNIPEWVLLQYGAALAGLTLVTLNPAYRPEEMAYALGQSRSAGIFLVPEYRGTPIAAFLHEIRPRLPELREAICLGDWQDFLALGSPTERLPEVRADEAALVLYTSGTTGFPKGAALHHRGITNNARFIAQRLGVQDGDVWLNFMPSYNVAGCAISVLGALSQRTTQVLASFDPGLALTLIEEEGANALGGAATMYIALTEHPDFDRRDLSSLRTLFAGGSVIPTHLVRTLEERLGVHVGIVYGQTEASGIITQTWPTDAPEDRAETIGQALPHAEVKIVDAATGHAVPPGTVGELCVRGYQVMAGYFEMPEATAQAVDPEGWLHTGDLCAMDERGYCRVEGRLKDMIIRGGQNIYPREIEELLRRHPDVSDVAVVGIPDEKYGEVVAAFVRPAPGCSPAQAQLHAFCREHLAPYKTPRHWIVVDAFPLTPSGKIQKFLLRQRFVGERASA